MNRFAVLSNNGILAATADTLPEAKAKAVTECRRADEPFAVYEAVAVCRPTETPVEWETLGMAAAS